MSKPVCYAIATKEGKYGDDRYETEAAAEAAIFESEVVANARVMDAKFRASVGKPNFTDNYELKARQDFDEAGYHPLAVEMTDTIYRLNELPSESVQLVNEIVMRLRHYDTVYLKWTCTGHTRAEWQGASAASWLAKHGFATETDACGDVTISRKEVRND